MSDAQEQEATKPVADKPEIYRREAVDYHIGAQQHDAALLHLTPAWVRMTYRLVLAVCIVAAMYSVIGRVNEYASGTAVIQSEGRVDVNAHVAGTVDAVSVRPGQRVTSGQPLVRLYAADEAANLARINNEIEQHLVSILRDPGDAAARSALASLRGQRDLAQARIDERIVRAPDAGVVSDVRIRPGQRLEPGDLVVSLISDQARFRVLAVLPGQYRPLLRKGMSMRLEFQGFPYSYQTVAIEEVSDEVVGPLEVQRYLPQSIVDAFEAQGPMVFVEARLPSRTFTVSDQPLGFYDGMLANAEVVVRSETILVMLIPGLRALMRDDAGGI